MLRCYFAISIVLLPLLLGCQSRSDEKTRTAFYDFYDQKKDFLKRYQSAKFRFVRYEPLSDTLGLIDGEVSLDHYILRHLVYDQNAKKHFPGVRNFPGNGEFEKILNSERFSGSGIGIIDYRNNKYKFGLRNSKVPSSINVENDAELRKPMTLDILSPVAVRYLGTSFSDLRKFPHDFEHFGDPAPEFSNIPDLSLSGKIELRLKTHDAESTNKSAVKGILHFLFDKDTGLCTALYYANGESKTIQTFVVENTSDVSWQLRVETYRGNAKDGGKWQLSERLCAICGPLEEPRINECYLKFHGLPEPEFGQQGFKWNSWWTMLALVIVLTTITFLLATKKRR